jgi:hypothetical protein
VLLGIAAAQTGLWRDQLPATSCMPRELLKEIRIGAMRLSDPFCEGIAVLWRRVLRFVEEV